MIDAVARPTVARPPAAVALDGPTDGPAAWAGDSMAHLEAWDQRFDAFFDADLHASTGPAGPSRAGDAEQGPVATDWETAYRPAGIDYQRALTTAGEMSGQSRQAVAVMQATDGAFFLTPIYHSDYVIGFPVPRHGPRDGVEGKLDAGLIDMSCTGGQMVITASPTDTPAGRALRSIVTSKNQISVREPD